MIKLISRRILQGILILIGVSFITFLLSFALPADPARMLAGKSATPETIASIRHELGLDKPMYYQYGRYLWGLLHGDMGRSYAQKTAVTELIKSRLPATIKLTLAGILIELLIAIPLGVMAALHKNRWSDRAVMLLSFLGVSAPQFALGLILLYVFGYKWSILPLGGYGTPAHIVLPALTLGISGAGWYARIIRSSMVEVLGQQYIRTAKAKGISKSRVVLKHALKNAMLPVVSMIGLDIGVFMSGIVVVESVFDWPGIGQLTWQAIQIIDIPVIIGVVTVSAIAIVLGNLLADLIYPVFDPRIKYQ
ncbi:MAG TPA: glutathione ABC transporter permease GsiC [Firmicutes bacterium]|jgi:peptide/nickel transport system permease protein|nr:glutathione ABC transporter permease GsiC [Bacillota bacterium]